MILATLRTVMRILFFSLSTSIYGFHWPTLQPPLRYFFSRNRFFSSPDLVGPKEIGHNQAVNPIPYQLALFHNSEFQCGASLVFHSGTQFVLTSASCVWSGNVTSPIESLKPIEIILRGKSMHRVVDDGFEERFANKIVIHPDFNPGKKRNDVAIVFTLGEFEANCDEFLPILLPPPGLLVPDSLRISGWGTFRYGQGGVDHLREFSVYVTGKEECQDFGTDDKQFCVKSVEMDQHGFCDGDPGSPVASYLSSTSRTWYLVGIMSHYAGSGECQDEEVHGVITNVSSYVEWIIHELHH